MKKTTVYLTDEEAEALRQAAARTGHSRSELIREGVRRATQPGAVRRFLSMGVGEGTGEPVGRRAEDLLAEMLVPRRPRPARVEAARARRSAGRSRRR